MNTSEEVLVVILAAALAVNLVLGFIVLIKLIQIINHVKKLVAKAEALTDKAEVVSSFFRKTAVPVAIGRLLANISDHLRSKKRSTEDEDDE